MDMKLASK